MDDEAAIASTIGEYLESEGFEVATAGEAVGALALAARFEPDLVICDVQLPGVDGLTLLGRLLEARPETLAMMITAYGTVQTAVAAFRLGAHDFLLKPVNFGELIARVDRLLGVRSLIRENQGLRRQLPDPVGLDAIVGTSPAIAAVKGLIRKVGPTPSNVLILGESGTGKELAARALHASGLAPDAPFLAINCAAIPHELLESGLFGHVRGAFTGADRDRAGLFAAAGRGTVFLDEIGELATATQAKLLRAIEAKEILPVGATRPITVEARVVAATNKDLAAEVAAGRFRADLFYRLDVVSIRMPSLRERRVDIPDLIDALLARLGRKLGKRNLRVDPSALRSLGLAPWRGNVRELDNALERAAILADGPALTSADFPTIEHVGSSSIISIDPGGEDDLRAAARDHERRHIAGVLGRCGWDKREAARRLGMGLSSLYRKLDELQISSPTAG